MLKPMWRRNEEKKKPEEQSAQKSQKTKGKIQSQDRNETMKIITKESA